MRSPAREVIALGWVWAGGPLAMGDRAGRGTAGTQAARASRALRRTGRWGSGRGLP